MTVGSIVPAPRCRAHRLLAILLAAILLPTIAAAQAQHAPADIESEPASGPFIRLAAEADVVATRRTLIRRVWDTVDPTHRRPTRIAKSGSFRWKGPSLPPDAEVWELEQTMPHDVTTTAFYVATPSAHQCLIVLVQGHLSELESSSGTTKLFDRLLAGGCHLIVHAMPLLGGNSQPVVDTRDFGRITLSGHDAFMFLETDRFSPMLYFFEPVAAALNAVLTERPYPFVGMVGLSGGGWTTTVYAALDERIELAVAIAGSWPISLRLKEPSSFGDWEQTAPRFYAHASYADLYLMAGHRERHLELIHIEHDPCCFPGSRLDDYREPILDRAAQLGSSIGFTVVPGQRHEINAAAADRLLGLVRTRTGLSFPAAAAADRDACREGNGAVRQRLSGPFTANGGFAWTTPLRGGSSGASGRSASSRSLLILCENDRPIGEGNTIHVSIRETGKGLYSHWNDSLYFSTSDNSNPNTNGRTYSIVIPED